MSTIDQQTNSKEEETGKGNPIKGEVKKRKTFIKPKARRPVKVKTSE